MLSYNFFFHHKITNLTYIEFLFYKVVSFIQVHKFSVFRDSAYLCSYFFFIMHLFINKFMSFMLYLVLGMVETRFIIYYTDWIMCYGRK